MTVLAGCASRGPAGGVRPGRDGPQASPPPNLAQVPDAEPKVESIRIGGPNKPYQIGAQSYLPITDDQAFQERGLASWYGRQFHGQPTASGEPYDMYAMTAAHPTLPIPSYARIRNPANGRQVIVRVNDRGPFHPGRIVDLSYTAALKLDLLRGTRPVELERITFDDIRTGAWRQRGDGVDAVAVAASVAAVPVAVVTTDKAAVAATPVDDTTSADPARIALAAGPATASVGAPSSSATTGARGFWVQLGAFREQGGAVAFRKQLEARVDGRVPLLTVFGDADLFKLQAGPYAGRAEALEAAGRLRGLLQLVPVVVERP